MKNGRNAPCRCGSGKKYKHCCLGQEQALAQERYRQEKAQRTAAEAAARQERQQRLTEWAALERFEQEVQRLTAESNAVVGLIQAGRLDEAEAAARVLLERYPDAHDGFDRLAMVYEARGDARQAAHWYRRCLEFIRAHREDFDPQYEGRYERYIAELDPQPAT